MCRRTIMKGFVYQKIYLFFGDVCTFILKTNISVIMNTESSADYLTQEGRLQELKA